MTPESQPAIRQPASPPWDGAESSLQDALNPSRLFLPALNAAANAVVIADRKGRIVWINRAFTELTGYTAQEVIGQNPRILKSGTHGSDVYDQLWRTILSGRVWRGEMVNRRKDGSLYYEDMTVTPVRDEFGSIGHFIAIKQDVTAHRQAEFELARSADRYRSLANSLPEIVIETDIQGNITFANANALQLLGYSSEDLQHGLKVPDITAPCDRERAGRDFSEIIGGHAVSSCEYDAQCKDGTIFPILVSATPIVEDGKTLGARAIAVDITERRRREQELRMTQFSVDRAGSAIFWLDAEGQVFYVNESACRYVGCSREELLQMRIEEFAADRSAESWKVHWKLLRERRTLCFEGACKRRDGSVFPVSVTADYFQFDGKEYEFAFVQDISLRKQAELALAEQKHLFDILMANVPDHIYFKDRESRFTQISRAQATYLGLRDPGEAVGKTDFDFFSAAHARQAYEDEQQILRTGQPILGKLERETWTDGRTAWVATSKLPLPDPSGRIVGTFGISRNITRSKTAEEALRASEEFNKRILESTSDGVCVLDLQGSVHYISAGGRKLLGFKHADDILDLRWPDLWEGAQKKRCREVLGQAAAGGIGAYQGSLRTPDGTPMLLDVVISPITNVKGVVERLVCVFRDITERQRLERELAQAQKLESIGQLAAGIAHEINTPIQYIGDNGKFLEEAFQDFIKASAGGEFAADIDLEYLRTEVPKAIAQLLQGVEHVARIVRAMKEFSHPGPVEKAPVDINRAIESTALVSRNEWKYVAELITDFDPELPRVPCVAGEFNQVILNLIVNAAHAIADAIKGSPGAKGTIRISTRRRASWAEVRVSDTGTGIAEEIQGRIFDPFFTTKPVGKGTGQGLAIAHAVIVQKHGGTISFESAPGAGTTFLIQLPLDDETGES